MKENIKAIKRLVAFFLCVFMVGSMIGNDIFAVATEENDCAEYVDEQTYAANVLQPVGDGDGYCDNCGHAEQTHVETPTETVEPAAETLPEESPALDENGNPIEGAQKNSPKESEDTPNEEVSIDDGQNQNPENTDNPEENIEETPELDENGNPIVKEDENKNNGESKEECEHDWSYTSNNDGTHLKKCSKCGEESVDNCQLSEEGKCELCGYQKTEESTEEVICEHEWEYISNEDGTHTKRCTKCGEEIVEECQLNEEGKCQLCGYEEPEECEHDWLYTDNKDGTHTKKCQLCGEEVVESHEFGDNGLCIYCEAVDMTLEEQSYSETFGDTTVTVSGMMPRNSKVTIYKAGTKIVEHLVNDKLDEGVFTAYEAYNINIYDAGGNKYQPDDNNDSVKVSFSGVSDIEETPDEEVTVFRIEDDYEITEIETEVKGDEVEFEAEHFSVYTTGSVTTGGKYIDFSTTLNDSFGYSNINDINSTYPYAKVTRVQFRLYADIVGKYTFNATSYKDISSLSKLDDGTAVSLGSVEVNATTKGWQDIVIPLTEISGQDSYITYGRLYSVVVVPGQTPSGSVKIGYDVGQRGIYLKSDTWDELEQDGVFFEKTNFDSPSSYNIELSANAGDTYTISEIKGPDPSSAVAVATQLNPYSSKNFLYSKGDKGTFTAVLSNANAERQITWKSSNRSVLDFDNANSSTGESNTGAFTAKAAGEAVVTATYVNSSGSTSATINVKVIQFTIGGTDPDGGTMPSVPYAGGPVTPEVKGYSNATNTSSITVNTSFSNNENVTEEALAAISYTISGKNFVFQRNFAITKLALNLDAFTNAKIEVSNGIVTAITNIDPNNTVYTAKTKPVFDRDFTASITSQTINQNGKTYVVDLTGQGNYTGSLTWTSVSTANLGITVELAENSKLNACTYKGSPVTLSEDWEEVVFKDTEGNRVDFINPNSATYMITDKGGTTASPTNAGQKTLVFTIKDSYVDGSGTTISPALAGTQFSVDFWISKADIGKTVVEWVNGNEFKHDGTEHKPQPGVDKDFNVTFNGNPVDESEYSVVYTGNYKDITQPLSEPAIVLSGTGKNFDSSTNYKKIEKYSIIANFENDLIIRIQIGDASYDGIKSKDYAIPYAKTYNGSKTAPNIIVMIPGKEYTKDTDYTLSVVDEGKNTYSGDVGTKQIIVTPISGGALDGLGTVTATYTIVPTSLTVGMVDISKLKKKTYTGSEINLVVAGPKSDTQPNIAVPSDYDIKLAFNGNILENEKDFRINYLNRINAGTATFSIEGLGNFKDTLVSSNYKFTIEPAELSSTDGSKALASIGVTSEVYTGEEFKPDVTIKLNGSEISQPDKISVVYQDNRTVGQATVTVTGSTNFTGTAILHFDITSNKDRYSKITIRNDSTEYTAEAISGAAGESTALDGTVTRYYTCNVPVTYTGTAFNGDIGVYVSGNQKLKFRDDYRYAYINALDANITKESDSPRLVIYGQGSYKNNNAVVYFNISPIDISATGINFQVTENGQPEPFQKAWTGSAVTLTNVAISVNGNALVEEYVNPDTSETEGDYTLSYPDDITSAGEKIVTVTGRGNYTGTRKFTYTVGNDISGAYVTIEGAHANGTYQDIFLDKELLKTLKENNGEESPLTNKVRWRGSTASDAPKITLYPSNAAGAVALSVGTDYTISDVPEFGTGNYYSRKVGEETGTNYNTVHVTINAVEGANGYYGTAEFYYDICPALIDDSTRITSRGTQNHYYEGDTDETSITVTPVLYFNNGTAIEAYKLNSDNNKDYEPATYRIGPNASTTPYQTKLTGMGNFTGEKILQNSVLKGYVKLYRSVDKDGSDKPKLIADTSNTSSMSTFTYNLSDDTKEYYTAYKFDGTIQYPLISVFATDGKTKLVPDTDYSIKITDEGSDTLTAKAGKKVITVSISEAHANIQKQTITMYYMVNTNSIETGYTAKLGDLDYEAVVKDAATIKDKVDSKKLSLSLSVGNTELEYGKDYEIITEDDPSGTHLAGIKAQTTTASETRIQGTNDKPGAGGVNYIYLHGLNAYSGYMKVPFNHVLNINSVYAKVYIENEKYELGATGEPTTPVTPIILYRVVGDASNTYNGDLKDITPYLDNVTVTRARDKKPGPDPNITVTAKANSACKGTVTQCTNETTTAGGTVQVKTVCFLADLGTYTGITMNSGTTYEYTGKPVTVSFTGLEGAVKAETEAMQGDYAVVYTQEAGADDTSTDAINVGTWYAVLVPTLESKYFIHRKTSANRFAFNIKYNLGSSYTKIQYYDGGTVIDKLPYTGSEIIVPAIITAAYGQKKDDGTSAEITIYDYKKVSKDPTTQAIVDTNTLVTIDPNTALKMGPYPILAEAKDSSKVYGTLNSTFIVDGVGIGNADVTLEYDSHAYTGKPLEPVVTEVKVNGLTLKKNSDYTVSYSSNVDVGTADVTLKGVNGYSGGKTVHFEITPVTITPLMVTVEDAYYAGRNQPVKPAITVKNGDHTLAEGVDYKIVKYGNNTSVRNDAFVQITAGTGSNYVVPSGDVIKEFPIQRLDLRSTNVTVEPSEIEWTGANINPYDKITVKVGNVELISDKTDPASYDYKIVVLKGGVETPLKDQGDYKIRIDGTQSISCAESIEKDFKVTERSLPNNYHHYYSGAENKFVGSTWTYDPTNKRYVSIPDGDQPKDTLTVYVYDVPKLGEKTNNLPTIAIVDSGAAKSVDDDGNITYGYELKEGTDFEITAFGNNTEAGSADWSKTLKVDDTHAKPTAKSPTVTLTGKGNYKGDITLPYNIGENINTLTLDIQYKVGTTSYPYDANYDNPTVNNDRWSYEYNGVPQKPDSITVKKAGTLLRENRDYIVTYTNAIGDEDPSTTAGYKNVVITGIGDYCGTKSQMYLITRKQVTDTAPMFTKESTMTTANGDLTFTVTGNAVSKLSGGDSGTAKKYLVDTGLMDQTAADNFVGYYFAVFNGSDIKPTVSVKDNKLGKYGTTPMIIDEEADLDIKYDHENEVTTFSKDTSGNVTMTRFSTINIQFKGNSSNSIGNYYTTSAGSVSYKIAYIIVQHDIEKDFNVNFKNEVDGNKYEYDDGKEITPEVEVTNGPLTLKKYEDYTLEYHNNFKPGVATVKVKGTGNYRGSKTLEFYIWGNLKNDVVICYKDEAGNYVRDDHPEQDYTGTSITYGSPRIYLILPAQNALTEDYILEPDVDYKHTSYGSEDDYITDGTVVYSGQASAKWEDDLTVNYSIKFNPDKVEATNYEPEYMYTGYPIVPEFKLNYPTAVIKSIAYYRNGDMTRETDDFTSLTGTNGKITAVITYDVGKEKGKTTSADYQIVPRPLSECEVFIESETTRYTGEAVKPTFKVDIISYDNNGDKQTHTLTPYKDGEGDYSVDYGNYTYGNAQVVLDAEGKSPEITGTRTEPYTIKLQAVGNLRVTENTGDSLTVKWVRDLYSDGTRLFLQKLDGDGNVISYRTVSGLTGNTYTFDSLSNSTTYKIIAVAYAGANEGIKSDEKWILATTDIGSTAFDVVSKKAGKATITMAESETVDMYYIYFSEDESSSGKVLAIIPASTGKYTKSGLTSGKTYYVHIEGYVLDDDNEPKQVNSSDVRPVTIK